MEAMSMKQTITADEHLALSKALCASLDVAPEDVSRITVLHDGVRVVGFDRGDDGSRKLVNRDVLGDAQLGYAKWEHLIEVDGLREREARDLVAYYDDLAAAEAEEAAK